MADPTPTTEETPKRGVSLMGMLAMGLLSLVASAGGFAAGVFLVAPAEKQGASNLSVQEPQAFVQFGDAVVNLDEGRLTRYLRISVTLQVPKSEVTRITKLVEDQKANLKSWLLGYLSDKGMDDIRGRAGQNRLRREIQDHFNSVLFSDGRHYITDVLFEEFNIQ